MDSVLRDEPNRAGREEGVSTPAIDCPARNAGVGTEAEGPEYELLSLAG